MRFTVLGKSPAWEDAGGACSSYLVEQDDYTLLIDCGNGAFAKLRERISYSRVDQVLVSHIHADHILDLVPFAYALTLGPGASERRRPQLLLPPAGIEALRALVSIWGSDRLIDAAFTTAEYEPSARLRLGPLDVALHPVPHFTLTHAVELTSPAGGRLVYSADCRAGEQLIVPAAGADLLLAEATLEQADSEDTPLEDRGHMSAGEAGALAEAAGVGRLVLTHISDELDPEAALIAARERFDGPVEVAATGSSWEL